MPYELCTSAIAGIGVFATTPLARGTLLWRADSRSQVVHTEATLRERLASLSSTEAIELLEHVYCWEGEARGAHMPSLVLCSPLRTVIWLGSRRQELERRVCAHAQVLEVVGDGKYWNHSRTRQNTGSGGRSGEERGRRLFMRLRLRTGNHPDGDGEGRGDGVSSYALRDIEAGEELLDDYALCARRSQARRDPTHNAQKRVTKHYPSMI